MKSRAQLQEESIDSIKDGVDLTHTEFQAHMPYMGVHHGTLTVQQEKLVMLVASGMSIRAGSRAAGYKNYDCALKAMRRPEMKKALDYFREQARETVKFTITNAHGMYMEAYTASSNATEMKNTTDSLVKLHGLVQQEPQAQVNVQINATAKQLERLSDEELIKIAGKETAYLEPSVAE
jgi:hypothetical protein